MSGQLVIYSPLEFSEALTKFVPLTHPVYPPESKDIVEPGDISEARKIDQMLRIL